MIDSRISRKRIARQLTLSFVVSPLLVIFCARAYGLDSNRNPSDYALDEWGPASDSKCGAVHSITQTSDGYLWIGCEEGLVRFNGIAFQLISGQEANSLPAGPVQQLANDADGSLWIRTRDLSLFRYGGKRTHNITKVDSGVTAIATGAQGQLIYWKGSQAISCCDGTQKQTLYRKPNTHRNLLVIALAETPSHQIWIGSRDAGLLSVENGNLLDYGAEVPDLKVNATLPYNGKQLWIGTDAGAVRWDGSHLTQSGIPAELQKAQIISLARDHEANLWAGTSHALYRVSAKGIATAVQPARLAGVNAIFEDREGSLWLGTDEGLARLRDRIFLSYPQSSELRRQQKSSPVYVDVEGRTWYSTGGGIVNWLRGPESGSLRIGPPEDTIYSIAGFGSEVWIGRRHGGLTLIRCNLNCRAERSYTQADGLAENSVTSLLATTDGALWAGTVNRGVSLLRKAKFSHFTAGSELASNAIRAIAQTPDRTVWFATTEGLSSYHEGIWRTFHAVDGLPPGGLNCLSVDSQGILWIASSYGLAFLRAGKIETVEWPSTPTEPLLGLANWRDHSLWIATPTHVFQVKRAFALSRHIGTGDAREFAASDGLLTGWIVRRSPSVTSDSRGRIWLSTSSGLSVVDPERLPTQSVPALPHVQAIFADGAELKLADRVEVPALRKRVAFDFIGLSLTAPQRVRYEYRLDNFDTDWSKPISSTEAIYTNLSPGTYRFRLRARNAAGAWSEEEDSVPVYISPAVWQTWWFETAAILAAAICFAAAYRYRLRTVKNSLNLRFEERLLERTRIAQELHDTLLQGFLSASMQLHVASNRLESNSAAKAPLERATELMRKAGDEGRAALRQLRTGDATSLEDALSTIPHESVMAEDVRFRLQVEGRTRALRPVLRDDIYRIAREAIMNAIRHSGATDIEVEICYHSHELYMAVQDNGRGIDLEVIHSGREGHWGIQGMRERAERIRAKLSLLSRPGGGTEVLLRVPGTLAYQGGRGDKGRWFRSALSNWSEQD